MKLFNNTWREKEILFKLSQLNLKGIIIVVNCCIRVSYCSPAGCFKCMQFNNCFFQSLSQLRNFKRSQLQFNHVINVNFLLKKTKIVFRLTSNTMSSLWSTYLQVFCILLWSRFVKEPSVLSDWPEIKEQLVWLDHYHRSFERNIEKGKVIYLYKINI